MLNKLKKIKAFTILELTIVIVIIGVLMAATMKFG
jgi:prepilin-type N-terminal cleavage/methylation domain-containing protein